MGRPPAKDLTERELEVMHAFWSQGEATAAEARDRLAATGLDRTYTTIANLVRGLADKGFLAPGQRREAVPLPGGAVVRGRLGAAPGRPGPAGLPGVAGAIAEPARRAAAL